eukprot:9178901-Pyramimonas_sp.AAC.1
MFTFMFLLSPRYCANCTSALKKTASITSIVFTEVFAFVLLRKPARIRQCLTDKEGLNGQLLPLLRCEISSSQPPSRPPLDPLRTRTDREGKLGLAVSLGVGWEPSAYFAHNGGHAIEYHGTSLTLTGGCALLTRS